MTIEILLPYLAGLLGVPVVNFIKSRFNLSGQSAVYLTVAVSALLAVASILLTGGFKGEDFVADLTKVFAVATAAYKLLPKPLAQLGA